MANLVCLGLMLWKLCGHGGVHPWLLAGSLIVCILGNGRIVRFLPPPFLQILRFAVFVLQGDDIIDS